MRSWVRWLLFLVAINLAASRPAAAWGLKGHQMANEAATWETPTQMPSFFHQAYPRLIYLAYDPDRWRGAGSSLDSSNPPDHYLDYEYVEHLDLPQGRYEFLDLMVSSGTLDRLSLSTTTAGFLPWKIAEISETLEDQWKEWLRSELLPPERRQVEENIIYNAGILGHYVADGANPHHSTIHYNGWTESPNPNDYPNDCSAHYRFETWFVTREIELSDVLSAMRPVTRRDDYFDAAMEMIVDSNAHVEDLYALDRDGAFDPGDSSGEVFAADRIALGASLLRDLWWSSWVRAGDRGFR